MASFTEFSEYEVKNSTVKFGANKAMSVGCVGKLEETLNQKTVQKKCEGVVKKSRTRGDGTGEIKYTLHMTVAAFRKMYGFTNANLKSGVYAYGENSRHEEFCYTCEVKDEDGNIKYKAYPRCCVQSGISRSIENGAEEVAEIEVTAAIMPDENGQAVYEAFAEDLDSATKAAWLNNFTPLLVSATNTYAVSMTVTPATAGVTVVDEEGSSVGYCSVDSSSGEVAIPKLKDGKYSYVVYADSKTPKAGTITVNGASPSAITVSLT